MYTDAANDIFKKKAVKSINGLKAQDERTEIYLEKRVHTRFNSECSLHDCILFNY